MPIKKVQRSNKETKNGDKKGDEIGKIVINDIITGEEVNTNIEEVEEIIKSKTQKIKENKIMFPALEGKMIHVKIGDKEYIPSKAEIDDIDNQLTHLLNSFDINCLVFVTHPFVEVKVIE